MVNAVALENRNLGIVCLPPPRTPDSPPGLVLCCAPVLQVRLGGAPAQPLLLQLQLLSGAVGSLPHLLVPQSGVSRWGQCPGLSEVCLQGEQRWLRTRAPRGGWALVLGMFQVEAVVGRARSDEKPGDSCPQAETRPPTQCLAPLFPRTSPKSRLGGAEGLPEGVPTLAENS